MGSLVRWSVTPAFWLAVLMLCVAPGCVRRRLLVRSNPPGAMVYVDNKPIGTTPCSTTFVYYGTREIRLVKPGFETLVVNQPIPAPWYELPPLDFVSENLVPREIQDYRTLTYNLQPQVIKPSEQLLGDAEQLRQYARQQAVVPAGALGPPTSLTAPTTVGPALPSQGAPPTLLPQQPTLAPEIVPAFPGTGVLPPGGRPLDPLPTP